MRIITGIILIVVCLSNNWLKGQDVFLYDNEAIYLTKEFRKADTSRINTKFGTFYNLQVDSLTTYCSRVGRAKLPQLSFIVEIPFCENVIIEEAVLEKEILVLDKNIKVQPKQKSKFKNKDDTFFAIDREYYTLDRFDREAFSSIKKIGIMGGLNLAKIEISPVRYNPTENLIEFVKKISIKIKFINVNHTKHKTLKNRMSRSFREFACNNFLITLPFKYEISTNNIPYSMVIIAPEEYKNTLIEFILWKKRKGINIIDLYTNQIGNSLEDIKHRLNTLYNTDTLTCFDYLLICGDVEQIPTFEVYSPESDNGHHCTDLYYADYTQDSIPDVFYGRISAKDTSELRSIISKIITYESYSFENDNFLSRSLIVAGKETKYNAPKLLDGQNNYIKNYLALYTDTSIYYHNQSLINRDNILHELNQGAGWVNYTAHCDYYGWYNPTINTEDINELSNFGKYGLFINNCCLSGKYDESECFTEALIRKQNSGAVSSIGASDYTLWEEDYYWSVGYKAFSYNPSYSTNNLGLYDRYFHTHNEPLNQQYITFGQMLFAGWLSVMQSSSLYTNYYKEIYNLQGDPSLTAYAGKGQTIISDYEKNIPVDTQTITFNTQPEAYVCLSNDDTIITATKADNEGKVCLDVSPVNEIGSLYLTISAQFFRPTLDTINFTAPLNGFAYIHNLQLTNVTTNEQVNHLEENTLYSIGFDIKNIGLSPLIFDNNSIIAQFRNTPEEGIILSDSIINTTPLLQGEERHLENVFLFQTPVGLKNNKRLSLVLNINRLNADNQKIMFSLHSKAPELDMESFGLLIEEDSIIVKTILVNKGDLPTQEGVLFIENINKNISVECLDTSEKKEVTFILDKTLFEDTISLPLVYKAGNYFVKKTFCFQTKRQSESFENEDFIADIVNTNTFPWVIDSSISFMGRKSFRSHPNLPNRQSSSFVLNTDNVLPDTVGFYVKVSSEENKDVFEFYLDNNLVFNLSGYMDWTYKTFLLDTGRHSLRFSYIKDEMVSVGEDAVWIDHIVLPYYAEVEVGETKIKNKDNIVMFPNPTKNNVYITNIQPNSEVYVYNSNSELVYFSKQEKNNMRMDTNFLKDGIYYIIFAKNKNAYCKQKLIVIH